MQHTLKKRCFRNSWKYFHLFGVYFE